MLYNLFRVPLILLFLGYYRRIHLANLKNVPKDIPLILISNHSTAFVEQMLIAAFLKRGVYFWARSSAFSKYAWVNKFYEMMHVLPITRREDGLKDARQNDRTFQKSYEHILAGKALFVAPEGNCVMEKRLRRFRTGTARVALGAAAQANFTSPVAIVPIGVNYTHHRKFREDVMVSFGQPIMMDDFKKEYANDPQRAAKLLTHEMKAKVLKEVISINEVADEQLTEQLFTLYRSESVAPVGAIISYDNSRLRMEQRLANMVNELEETNKSSLAQQSKDYFTRLKANDLDDKMFHHQQKLSWTQQFLMFLMAVPAILGRILGLLPIWAAKKLRLTQIKTDHDQQFWAPLAMIMVLICMPVYTTVLAITASFWISWWALALFPAIYLLQFVQILFMDYWKAWKVQLKSHHITRQKPALMGEVKAQRQALKDQVETYLHPKNGKQQKVEPV